MGIVTSDQSLANSPPLLTKIESKRITDEKMAIVKAELLEAMNAVLVKNGLSMSRQLFRLENSREISALIRLSVIDANGFDALQRDLLEYCAPLGFKASILNASLISEGKEYQVTGLDLSTKVQMFRLTDTAGGDNVKYIQLDQLKQSLPNYFFS